MDWAARSKTQLKKLSPEQANFIQHSEQLIKKEGNVAGRTVYGEESMLLTRTNTEHLIPQTPEDGCWEHELYFVSHMFKPWNGAFPTYNYVEP
jgi:hypothetical protein